MTLHPIDTRYELLKLRERALLWFVNRLPREVVYRAAIRLGAHATTGEYASTVVPDLTFMDAIKRWPVKDNRRG